MYVIEGKCPNGFFRHNCPKSVYSRKWKKVSRHAPCFLRLLQQITKSKYHCIIAH